MRGALVLLVLLLAGCAAAPPPAPAPSHAQRRDALDVVRCSEQCPAAAPLPDAPDDAPAGWTCIGEDASAGYKASVWRQPSAAHGFAYGLLLEGAPADQYGVAVVGRAVGESIAPEGTQFFHGGPRLFVQFDHWPDGGAVGFDSWSFRSAGAPAADFGAGALKVRAATVQGVPALLLQFATPDGTYTFAPHTDDGFLLSQPGPLDATGARGHVHVEASQGLRLRVGFDPPADPQLDKAQEAVRCPGHTLPQLPQA